jgi:hypothetical protein
MTTNQKQAQNWSSRREHRKTQELARKRQTRNEKAKKTQHSP